MVIWASRHSTTEVTGGEKDCSLIRRKASLLKSSFFEDQINWLYDCLLSFFLCKAMFEICYGFSQDSIQGLDVFKSERQTLGNTPCRKGGNISRATEDSGFHLSFSWFRSSEDVVKVFCIIARRCWSLRFCRSFNLYWTENPFSPFRICILLWSHICGFRGERTGGIFLILKRYLYLSGWV